MTDLPHRSKSHFGTYNQDLISSVINIPDLELPEKIVTSLNINLLVTDTTRNNTYPAEVESKSNKKKSFWNWLFK
ncbi:hypothetical protein GJU39_20975 [Pedobacter petrophilus]|uniref:Uncharacterized protein n=1 Tax=Pedobacter petrophilus TaxID=1908241 RepID=A0A7K0G6D4_9SPHI|nr:hypothetical protein [Pedobacter petrophilus]MRX78556.1 hypothetical protein [Pedobacter petrophilus]